MIRKIYLSIMALILAAMLTLVFTGCNNAEDAPKPTNGIVEFTLSTEEAELDRYETVTLTVSGSEDAVTWESSAIAVATVANGVVTPTGTGTAVITAKVGNFSKTCTVTVTDSGTIPDIVFDPETVEVLKGKTLTIAAKVMYKGRDLGVSVALESNHTQIATIANSIVTGVAVGETTINASASYMGLSLTKSAVVKVKFDGAVVLSDTDVSLYTKEIVGKDFVKSCEITAYALKQDVRDNDAIIVWTSGNEEIATVNNGIITANKSGTTYVRATCTIDDTTIYSDINVTVEKSYTDSDKVLNVDKINTENKVNVTDYPDAVSVVRNGEVISEKDTDLTIKNSVIDSLADGEYDVEIHTADMYYKAKMNLYARYAEISLEGFSSSQATATTQFSLTKVTDTTATGVAAIVGERTDVYRYNVSGIRAITAGVWETIAQKPIYNSLQTKYEYLVFDIYFPADIAFRNDFAMRIGPAMYDFGQGVELLDSVRVMNSQGQKVKSWTTGEWFTFVIKHEDIFKGDHDAFGFAYQHGTTVDHPSNSSQYYLDNLRGYIDGKLSAEYLALYEEEEVDFEEISLEGFSSSPAAATTQFSLTKVTDTTATGVAAIVGERTDVYCYNVSGIRSITAGVWETMAQKSIYNSLQTKYEYLVFDIYFPADIAFRNDFAMRIGPATYDFGQGVELLDAVRVMNSQGQKVKSWTTGEWFTFVIKHEDIFKGDHDAFGFAYQHGTTVDHPSNSSQYYLDNLRGYIDGKLSAEYLALYEEEEVDFEEISLEGFSSSPAAATTQFSLTKVTDTTATGVAAIVGERTDVYCYNVSGIRATTAGVWETMAQKSIYNSLQTKYEYLVFDIYFPADIAFRNDFAMRIGPATYDFGQGVELLDAVRVMNSQGQRVTSWTTGEWFTFVIKHEGIFAGDHDAFAFAYQHGTTVDHPSNSSQYYLDNLRGYADGKLSAEYLALYE